MKKNLLALVLCVVMAGVMVTGCGGDSLPSASEVTFSAEPEYVPNTDYDKFTVIEFTIEDANATFPVTVSSSKDDSEMELHFNFFGDEQLVIVKKSGDTFEVLSDMTGFMTKDSPIICQKAIDENNWAATGK